MREVIFSEGDFTLFKESGIGNNDTPWEGLIIKSEGLAEKHVVEVRLNSDGFARFDGEPVHYKYTGANVSHGMRMQTDSFTDTQEYIEVLQNALSFAKRVYKFIQESDEWRA